MHEIEELVILSYFFSQNCTMSEIESRLYDKFNITVTDVKALLADSSKCTIQNTSTQTYLPVLQDKKSFMKIKKVH